MNTLLSMLAGAMISASFVAPKPYYVFTLMVANTLIIILRSR